MEIMPSTGFLCDLYSKGEIDREEFVTLFASFQLYPELAKERGELAADAIDKGIKVIGIDPRQSLHLYRNKADVMKSQDPALFNEDALNSMNLEDMSVEQRLAWALKEVNSLSESYPEIMEHYHLLETFAFSLVLTGHDTDAVAATLLRMQGDPSKNAIVIYGANHAASTDVNTLGNLDEAILAKAGVHSVTDVYLYDLDTLNLMHRYHGHPVVQQNAYAYDQLDWVYLPSNDEALSEKPGFEQKGNRFIYKANLGISTNYPELNRVEEMLPKENFTPLKTPTGRELMKWLNVAMPEKASEMFGKLQECGVVAGVEVEDGATLDTPQLSNAQCNQPNGKYR
jgi:hypothetical protein